MVTAGTAMAVYEEDTYEYDGTSSHISPGSEYTCVYTGTIKVPTTLYPEGYYLDHHYSCTKKPTEEKEYYLATLAFSSSTTDKVTGMPEAQKL